MLLALLAVMPGWLWDLGLRWTGMTEDDLAELWPDE